MITPGENLRCKERKKTLSLQRVVYGAVIEIETTLDPVAITW